MNGHGTDGRPSNTCHWHARLIDKFGVQQQQSQRPTHPIHPSIHLPYVQELGLDPNGRPDLMSAPLDSLRSDFPLRPRLAGALVPQNVNLWMGHTKGGGPSSSGLHHDFHDNLYVLLRGKKTFRCVRHARGREREREKEKAGRRRTNEKSCSSVFLTPV